MSFPQQSSVTPVLQGQQAFRLTTPIAGPGDVYESEVGALAFAIGPNSDMCNVLVTAFDPETDGGVTQMIISPDRWFIGRTDARNDSAYSGSGRRGRILFSLQDIYDPEYEPLGFVDGDAIVRVTPVLDFLQYFVNPPAFTPQRSDRNFQFQYLTPPDTPGALASTWLIIPAYGRKSGFFSFRNQDAGSGSGETINVTVNGVQLSTSMPPGVRGSYQQSLFTANVLDNSSAKYAYKSSADGLWDLFVIQLGNYRGNAMPITVTLSDDLA
jgi:hypothetical protein